MKEIRVTATAGLTVTELTVQAEDRNVKLVPENANGIAKEDISALILKEPRETWRPSARRPSEGTD